MQQLILSLPKADSSVALVVAALGTFIPDNADEVPSGGLHLDFEARKPAPAGAKAIYFFELTGPEVLTSRNTTQYVAEALEKNTKRTGYTFYSLLASALLPERFVQLLTWRAVEGRFGVIAATKGLPRGETVTTWDPEFSLGEEWSLTRAMFDTPANVMSGVSSIIGADAVTAEGLANGVLQAAARLAVNR